MQVTIQCNVHQTVLQIHLFMGNYVFIIVQIIILGIKSTKNVLYHQIVQQTIMLIINQGLVYLFALEIMLIGH